jgi:Outer membrane efflux protein
LPWAHPRLALLLPLPDVSARELGSFLSAGRRQCCLLWVRSPAAPWARLEAAATEVSAAALANYDGTVASYRQATLDAFQQVEDNLAALRILDQEAQQQARAVVSAQESLQRFTNRYKGGVDTYLQVITAQTAALANERNQVDIQRRRMDASVLLVKALGGGWNVADLPQL